MNLPGRLNNAIQVKKLDIRLLSKWKLISFVHDGTHNTKPGNIIQFMDKPIILLRGCAITFNVDPAVALVTKYSTMVRVDILFTDTTREFAFSFW